MKPLVATCIGTLLLVASVGTASAASLECVLHFDLSSWSLIYKHSSGKGVVKCKDGTSLNVSITANGGGLTAGKTTVKDGIGNFSDVNAIGDVLGTYVQAGGSAAAGKSGAVQVLTKDNVSLSLAGTGKGIALGVDIGGLTLKRAD